MVGVGFGLKIQTNNNNNTMQIPKSQRIACRICEQIFSTPQTLILHIESCHMKNDISSPTTPSTNISSSAGKPLSLTLNLVSSAISGSKTTFPSPTSAAAATARSYANPFLYQNMYNNFPAARSHIDLNYYRNYLHNHGRYQNGFPATTPPLHFPATAATMRNNSFVFGQPQPPPPQQQQMHFYPETATPSESGDRTLPLLCQIEHRSADTYIPTIIVDDDSGPNFVDLTLKL